MARPPGSQWRPTTIDERSPLKPPSSSPTSRRSWPSDGNHRRAPAARASAPRPPPRPLRRPVLALLGAALVGAAAAVAVLCYRGSAGPLPPKPADATQEFDYIVVGGGPAGSVVAESLSRNPAVRVLLLEAGHRSQAALGGTDFVSKPLTQFDVPLLWSTVAHRPEYHWPIDGAMIAKALGGCGVHNAMLYVRALKTDIEGWALKHWQWPEVLARYMRLEDYIPTTGGVPSWHGAGGPIATSGPGYVDQVAPSFVVACESYGMRPVDDFNAPDGRAGDVVGYYHFNTRDGTRDSAARALLKGLLHGPGKRENLVVRTGATAERVLFAPARLASGTPSGGPWTLLRGLGAQAPPRATGVEYVWDGATHAATLAAGAPAFSTDRRARSVVLTAGAIMTSKLLLASGIGHSAKLLRAGVTPLEGAPELRGVGRNLQDHPSVAVVMQLDPEVASHFPNAYMSGGELSEYTSRVLQAEQAAADAKAAEAAGLPGVRGKPWGVSAAGSRFGIYSSVGLTAGAFFSTSGAAVPNIQLTVFPQVTEPHYVASLNGTRGDDGAAAATYLCTVALLTPQGRMGVALNATHPVSGVPSIEKPRSWLTAADKAALAEGVRIVRRLHAHAPLTRMTVAEVEPGPAVRGDAGSGDLEAWVGRSYFANSHWCGSARMGRANDPDAVVDEADLRVRGVDGLVVADASVIPTIPNGNVHSTVLVIASAAADMVKARWTKKAVEGQAGGRYV